MRRAAPIPPLALLLIATVACAAPSTAPSTLRFIPRSTSRVELQGSATIGDWSCRSANILGQVVVRTDWRGLNAALEQLGQSAAESSQPPETVSPDTVAVEANHTSLSVPVATLKANSRGMEEDLRRALREPEHPLIVFEYQGAEGMHLGRDAPGGDLRMQLRVRGILAMAGARRPLYMDVTIVRNAPHGFHVHAVTPLRMSDFGVTPPSAFFGLIRAHDKVIVIFDLDLVDADS